MVTKYSQLLARVVELFKQQIFQRCDPASTLEPSDFG